MGNFSEREEAFENKFKHDQDFRFKVHSKAVKLFALWTAKTLKLGEDESKKYIDELIEFDIDDPRSGDLERKVQADLKKGGIEMSEKDMVTQLDRHIKEAKKHLMEGS